ncbi:MAG TPA: four-helix bundle copper-binding protein [Chthoniobacterales bacterium]
MNKSWSGTVKVEHRAAQELICCAILWGEVEGVMNYIEEMFETHPVKPTSNHPVSIECIAACYACTAACNACADACLGEKDVAAMVDCIRDCNDCADVCLATARIMSRFTRTDFKLAGAQLRACIQACHACGEVCQKHGSKMGHCRVCAEACARCLKACDALLAER